MPPLFKLFHELDPSNMDHAIKVRVVRIYPLNVGEDLSNVYSLECLFHDAEGSRLHGSVRRAMIPKVRHMMREGHLYAIKNFVLTPNHMKLKTSIAENKIFFIPKTQIVEVFDASFPRNIFNFKTYDDLSLWENADENVLIDAIGRLSSRSARQTREVQGKETAMLDITLKNLQDNVLSCTIWGQPVDDLLNHLEQSDGPVVVIMQLCKIRKFRGEIRLSNTFKVSKIIYNGDVREISDFHRGLVLEGNFEIPVVDQLMPTLMPIRDDLEMSRERIITLDRLIRLQQVNEYWVFCQIVAIEPMTEWFYVACKTCFKKMAVAGSYFYCVKCDKSDRIGTLRYKVHVRVADNWEIAGFLLWDKECQQLLGMPAEQLKSVSNGEVLPSELSKMVGFKGLFKVDVRDIFSEVNLGPYPVKKMTSDVKLINEYSNVNNVSEVDNVPEPVLAPMKVANSKFIPTTVIARVKRNLLDDFNEAGEDVRAAKVAKGEDD